MTIKMTFLSCLVDILISHYYVDNFFSFLKIFLINLSKRTEMNKIEKFMKLKILFHWVRIPHINLKINDLTC
jgi:hypothetical protein